MDTIQHTIAITPTAPEYFPNTVNSDGSPSVWGRVVSVVAKAIPVIVGGVLACALFSSQPVLAVILAVGGLLISTGVTIKISCHRKKIAGDLLTQQQTAFSRYIDHSTDLTAKMVNDLKALKLWCTKAKMVYQEAKNANYAHNSDKLEEILKSGIEVRNELEADEQAISELLTGLNGLLHETQNQYQNSKLHIFTALSSEINEFIDILEDYHRFLAKFSTSLGSFCEDLDNRQKKDAPAMGKLAWDRVDHTASLIAQGLSDTNEGNRLIANLPDKPEDSTADPLQSRSENTPEKTPEPEVLTSQK